MAAHETHVEELTTHYNNEIQQARERIIEMNTLLHQRSVNIAEDERYIVELTNRLRKQLSILDGFRTCWRIRGRRANSRLLADGNWPTPGRPFKAKLFHRKAPPGFGHLERIVAAYSKWRKTP